MNKDYCFNTLAEANKYIRGKLHIVKDFLTADKNNRVFWMDWDGTDFYGTQILYINLHTLHIYEFDFDIGKGGNEGYILCTTKISDHGYLSKKLIDDMLHFKLYTLSIDFNVSRNIGGKSVKMEINYENLNQNCKFILNNKELDLCRQWFDALYDTHRNYLEKQDYILANKIYDALPIYKPLELKKYLDS